MRIRIAIVLLSGIVLAGCRMQLANRVLNGGQPIRTEVQVTPSATATEMPTNTPVPTATLTPTPTLDPAAAGLPPESGGATALDFTADMCKADWFSEGGPLPCPGDEAKPDLGYVLRLPGDAQGLQPDFPVLLMYPPQQNYETIFGKYPPFEVQKGDRFRAVLACRLHTFCDIEFALDYYSANGRNGLAHWRYLFTDEPIMVDFALDGIAGLKVQFGLSVQGSGNRMEGYGVWIMPHIFRPAP